MMLLGMFPPKLREGALESKALRDRLSLSLEVALRLDAIGVSFRRSILFQAIRQILNDPASRVDVPDIEEVSWQLKFNADKRALELVREEKSHSTPDFTCLHPVAATRLEWFDRENKKFELRDDRMSAWRQTLERRPLDDEEVDELFKEYRLSPRYVSRSIENHLRRRSVAIDILVPNDIRYFERLVGQLGECRDVKEFYNKVVTLRNAELVSEDLANGFRTSFLLCAHPFGAGSIPSVEGKSEELSALFKWILSNGDLVSQVGAMEWGLTNLNEHPALDELLTKIAERIRSEDAKDREGRLRLFSALVVLVDGELAGTGICRNRPPFWRRLASIAHAAIIERAILATGMITADFVEWAMENRGFVYYLQTFIDLRREPRWLPDFIFPEQLKPEFAGRIVAAAAQAALEAGPLRDLILGDGDNSLRTQVEFPDSFFPGPLEGGSPAIQSMPEDVEAALIKNLQKDEITPRSFATLVNSALVWKLDQKWADLAADRLRQAKYQLRDITSQNEAFTLLSGLSTVAAVTRSKRLAEETRILMRVIKRKPGLEITMENAVRISLIAAAAYQDLGDWCKYVGDCLSEFAFEDMAPDKALVLRNHIAVLRLLEPALWRTSSRADAAVTGLLAVARTDLPATP
ncbi:hypothetical protein KMZ29_26130 [Bradyrhizobium sediminis]|uniref:GreAB-C-like domain-containing protein n=1 Tax=Bradyrhizobium sediminis TaxID=2840469 RepID=A0A975RM03_9BRAD|nr:hypothetical protein [Bradyrhizobium sediminis]QWG13107.1 hypothetical protein KMZ29_26130 [Bradyrhizobium sediminis]